MYGITKQQKRALEFIEQSTRANGGVCPSYREIADAMRLSLGPTTKLIDRLVERGRLRRLPNHARALEVVSLAPREPAIPAATGACEMLVRHYRACDLSDARIVGLTDLEPGFVCRVLGRKLLPPNVIEALRSQPGVP